MRRPTFYLLRDILEFRLLVRAARAATGDLSLVDQARLRFSCLRGDSGFRRWPGWEPI
ncbi:hypothetical protein ABIA39_004456 [Nocardia sp. GAS34]|uniref:hypothetical protein n=1 Tax=unclassified Nocardia TaxID=2637762 RepID=UPI003D1C8911